MIGKNFDGGPRPAAPPAPSRDSWPTPQDHDSVPLSNYGLFLYLTFEGEFADDWWPLPEEGGFSPRRGCVRSAASGPKSRQICR